MIQLKSKAEKMTTMINEKKTRYRNNKANT